MNWKSEKGQIMVKIEVTIESLKKGLSALVSSCSPFKPQVGPRFLPTSFLDPLPIPWDGVNSCPKPFHALCVSTAVLTLY